MAHVAGYVVGNDVSARDWQGVKAGAGRRASTATASGSGRRAPTRSTRSGPVFVTADEFDGPPDLPIRSWRIPGSGPGRRHSRSRCRTTDTGQHGLRHPDAHRVHQRRRSPSSRATSSRPGRRPASASSATRRSSSSRAIASGSRSRGSARWRTRSSTRRRSTDGGDDARPGQDGARPGPRAARGPASRRSASTTSSSGSTGRGSAGPTSTSSRGIRGRPGHDPPAARRRPRVRRRDRRGRHRT